MYARNEWQIGSDLVDLRRPSYVERPVSVAALPQRLTFDLSRTALLVIDMQNDFCHPTGWLGGIGVDVTGARTPIPVLIDLLPRLRAADVPIVWVNWANRADQANLPPGVRHVYDPEGRGTGIGSRTAPNGNPVLQKDSWSAAIVAELRDTQDDLHIDKYRMSGFPDTPLDSVLRNLRVDTVLFAGVNADQCVLATLMDAANLGYDVVMLEDAIGTTSPGFCLDATLYNVRQCFGFTARAADLLTVLPA